MQNSVLVTAPKVSMTSFDNLFLELCSKTCNLKCKNCYIEKSYKNEPDFIELEKIKEALSFAKEIKHENKGKGFSIYLTGGEPMLHPDFNKILRMCLKVATTTVITNGTMINDKKARFLRKIDDESSFETIYRISLDTVDEIENDNLRGRGSFRKALLAITSLLKYEFNPIIAAVNYKNRNKKEIFEEFRNYFKKRGFSMEEINLKIIPYFQRNMQMQDIEPISDNQIRNLDCSNSRVVSKGGVYSCPMLANDYRARVGSSLEDFSDTNYLDCEFCSICAQNETKAQANDWM